MTFAPLFDSPCDLAQRIPSMVSDFLDLENKIGRRFREDSVTDIIIASLLKIGGSNATVLVPPEVKTGGDFDILIVEPATGDAIQYRIQAKRLSPHATNWAWGSYRELDHPHGQGGQSSTLIRSSAHESIQTIPLYAFYNPQVACSASSGEITGVELADGRKINQVVKTLVKAKANSKRPRLKRVGYLRELFFPLSTILCPSPADPDPGPAAILPPRISRSAVLTAIASRATPDWMWDEEGIVLPPPRGGQANALPAPSEDSDALREAYRAAMAQRRYPAIIERVIGRQPDEDQIRTARVKRPKLVLVSKEGF